MDEFLPGRINVLGRVKGRGEKKPLLFSAHLDTTPIGAQDWSFPPFAGDVVDGHIRGRGASDMKSAVAAFVAAAADIAGRDTPLAGDIILAFTAGESSNCLGAKRFVEQGLQDEIGAFLCGEPSTLDIITVEKAILWLEAKAVGKIGHVSGELGINAISLMAKFLTELESLTLDLPQHPLLSDPTINVGRIEGGSAVNVTPDACRAEVDVRFGPGIEVSEVIHQIELIMPEGISLEVSDFKPAVEENPESEFVSICKSACRKSTGSDPEVKGVSYYSDGAILLDGIKAPFAIVGPGYLGMSGQRDETILVRNLRDSVDIYRRIAEEWLA
nr:M20 family metallopeptidase [Pseudohalocynthiibacter aestuariivivens]